MSGIEFDKTGLAKKAITEATEVALTACAQVIHDHADARCPVKTGKLVGSLTVRVRGTEARVGTGVEYAPWVEYGTSKWPTGKPFLKPGFLEAKPKIESGGFFKREYDLALARRLG